MENDVSLASAKRVETLPEDIYRLLEDAQTVGHEVSEENVLAMGEAFMGLLRTRFEKRPEKKGEEVLRFSALGKKDRQIWYQANKPEVAEPIKGKQLFKFMYGDVLELLMLFLAMESGHEVTDLQMKVEEDGVHGSIDAIIDGVLVDAKSASPYSFRKFVEGSYVFDDPFGYVSQLSGYAAKCSSDRAGFLVCDKVSGDIAFVELDEHYVKANPPKPRIDHLREVIASETPPEKCYSDRPEGKSGNRRLDTGCSYCDFREDCWSDSNNGRGLRTFFYSGGPKFMTHVAKEPRVDEA